MDQATRNTMLDEAIEYSTTNILGPNPRDHEIAANLPKNILGHYAEAFIFTALICVKCIASGLDAKETSCEINPNGCNINCDKPELSSKLRELIFELGNALKQH